MMRLQLICIAVILLISKYVFAQDDIVDSSSQKIFKVVIVSMKNCCNDSAWIEAEEKVQDEFKILNLPVKVELIDGIATDEREQRIELEKIAFDNDAICALRIVRPLNGTGGIDLWINDRITKKTIYKNISIPDNVNNDGSIIALQLIELFEASLIELNLSQNIKDNVNPPPEIEKIAKEIVPSQKVIEIIKIKEVPITYNQIVPEKGKTLGQFEIRSGINIGGSFSGTGILGSVNGAFRWSFMKFFSVELEGMISFTSEHIESQELEAIFNIASLRGWIFWEILRHSVFRPSLGAGAGMITFWTEGVSSGEYKGQTDYVFVGYGGISAQLGIILTEHLWLRAGIQTGFLLPEIAVKFAEEEVARFGIPLVEGFFDLCIHFP